MTALPLALQAPAALVEVVLVEPLQALAALVEVVLVLVEPLRALAVLVETVLVEAEVKAAAMTGLPGSLARI